MAASPARKIADFWGIVVQSTRKTARQVNPPPWPAGRWKDIWGLILDVGEQLFAANGYSGTSIRDIATHAGVNQALNGYHFGSRRPVIRAVFSAGALQSCQRRSELLDALESRRARPPTVRELVEATWYRNRHERRGPAGLAFAGYRPACIRARGVGLPPST